MDIDQEELLQRTYALSVENNKLLKKLRRGAWFGGIFKVIFWAVALGVPLWAYFTILQPMMEQSMAAMDQVRGIGSQVGIEVPDSEALMQAVPGMNFLQQFTEN